MTIDQLNRRRLLTSCARVHPEIRIRQLASARDVHHSTLFDFPFHIHPLRASRTTCTTTNATTTALLPSLARFASTQHLSSIPPPSAFEFSLRVARAVQSFSSFVIQRRLILRASSRIQNLGIIPFHSSYSLFFNRHRVVIQVSQSKRERPRTTVGMSRIARECLKSVVIIACARERRTSRSTTTSSSSRSFVRVRTYHSNTRARGTENNRSSVVRANESAREREWALRACKRRTTGTIRHLTS